MGAVRKPASLVFCACTVVVDYIAKYGKVYVIKSEEYETLSRFLSSMPENLFNVWAERFHNELEKRKITTDIQYLPVNCKLTTIDMDSFPNLNVQNLTLCSMKNPSLKILNCRYDSFFWKPAELKLAEKFIAGLCNLERITLHHVNLERSLGFLENIGKHCKKVKLLDLSYSSIPQSELSAIPVYFESLVILLLHEKGTAFDFCLNTTELSIRILTTIKSLKLFEDGSCEWSSVLPAFHKLSLKSYKEDCAAIERINAHQMLPVNRELMKFIKLLTVHDKLLQNPPHTIISWLQNSFSGLQHLRLRISRTSLSNLRNFLQHNMYNITEVALQINTDEIVDFVQVILQFIPKLSKLQISNESRKSIRSDLDETMDRENISTVQTFTDLAYLSYSGRWTEKLARMLLVDSFNLSDLFLKVDFFPSCLSTTGLSPKLTKVTIDHSLLKWRDLSSSILENEIVFLSKVINSSFLLNRLTLDRIPCNEKKLLSYALKCISPSLEIM